MNTITITIDRNEPVYFWGVLAGAIIAIIIFGIGFFLVKNTKIKNTIRIGKYLKWAAPVVLGVAIFVYIPQIRNVLVALASIVAVVIAIFSYDQSRQIRKDTLDRENRDRKERLLKEIIEWAEDISNSYIKVNVEHALKAEEGGKTEQILTESQLDEWGIRLQQIENRGKYRRKAAEIYGGDLKEILEKLNEYLVKLISSIKCQSDIKYNQSLKLLDIQFQNESSTSFRAQVGITKEVRATMQELAEKVIEVATNIKIENLR